MDWGTLEADLLHIQSLMKDTSFDDASEAAKNCVESLDSTITTLAPNDKLLATNCLMVHRAMCLLRSEEFSASLNAFELVNARRAFSCASELSLSDRSFRGVLDLSRDLLLHSNLNASVAAENCGKSQLTQSFLERAVQLYREQLLTKHEAVTWHRLGKLLHRQNKQTQAGLSLNTASLLFKKCQLPVLEAESLCDLAAVYLATSNTSRLSEVMEQSHFICLSLAGQPSDQLRLYARLAALYSAQHAYPDAALCLGHVIAGSGGGAGRARGLVRRGQLLRWMGERDRWERAMRDASEECKLLVPKEASEVLISIAQEWSEVGLYRQTEEHLERAVRTASQCKGAELVMADALEELGDVLVKQRRRSNAVASYREACLLLEKLYDENGVENVGRRLQRVWSKYSSSRLAAVERVASITEEDTLLDDSLVCEGSSERQAASHSNELDTRSLVTVSEMSELDCNETLLPTDTPTNRSLIGAMDAVELDGALIEIPATSSPNLEDSLVPAVDPPNEITSRQVRPKTRRIRSKITHSFRGSKISPQGQASSGPPKEESGLEARRNGADSSSEVSSSHQDLGLEPPTNRPLTSRTCSLL